MSFVAAPRVVKLGGSLLKCEGLPGRLTNWLAHQSPAPTVLLVGGGPLAEAIRQADRLHGLGEEAAHWLCIDCMDISARLVSGLLPGSLLVDNWGELLQAVGEARGAGQPIVFECRAWLREEEPEQEGRPLSHGWHVTSDSIAARLAEVLGAAELVLLKSCDPPTPIDPAARSAAGYTDEHFPLALGELPLRLVNLLSQP